MPLLPTLPPPLVLWPKGEGGGSFLCHYLPDPWPFNRLSQQSSRTGPRAHFTDEKRGKLPSVTQIGNSWPSAQRCLAAETPSLPLTKTTLIVTIMASKARIALPPCQAALTRHFSDAVQGPETHDHANPPANCLGQLLPSGQSHIHRHQELGAKTPARGPPRARQNRDLNPSRGLPVPHASLSPHQPETPTWGPQLP